LNFPADRLFSRSAGRDNLGRSLVPSGAFQEAMKRFLPLGFCLIATAAMAQGYSQAQRQACDAALSPGSRAKVIADCTAFLKTPKLPAIISGPAYLARGNAYALQPADFSKALSDFNAASSILPRDPKPLNAAGIVFLKQRKLLEAFSAFDAARLIDGRDPTALYGRGLSRLAMGQGGQKDMDMAMGYDKGVAAFFKKNDLYP
jgi:tetratricopeptide (TPR) repeat protein